MERNKILLGATTNGSLIFARISQYSSGDFTASFNEVDPTICDKDYFREAFDSYKDCFNVEQWEKEKRRLCNYFDVGSIASVRKVMVDNAMSGEGIADLVDNSLFPEVYDVPNIGKVFFHSSGCGQHDTRKDFLNEDLQLLPNATIINRELYDVIHHIWDMYHLKPFEPNAFDQLIEEVDAYMKSFDMQQWIISHCQTFFKK